MRTLLGTRKGWAMIASALMLAALITERIEHPLAATLFDVASDFFGLLGVLLLTVTPLVLECLIRHPKRTEELVRWGRALGAVTLCFAWLLHLMMWPAYCAGWAGMLFGSIGAAMSLLNSKSGLKLSEATCMMGYGLLVYAPLISTIVLLFQHAALKRLTNGRARSRRIYWLSLTAAAVVFVLRPAILGYHIRQAVTTTRDTEREKSLTLLRLFGAEYDLRVLAFRRPPTYPSFLAGGTILGNEIFRHRWDSAENARKVYFLMTGTPFSKAATPPAQRSIFDRNDQMQIEETGGERVGSTIAGLRLASSERQVRYRPESQTAETLWTMVFDNTTTEVQEARATLTLPEGMIVSDAWLWIEGQPRPAAFGGKAQVRAAYQEVAVVQRRDPLLVTCTDPRRVLIQCFPVLPKNRMQIRLQLTQTVFEGNFKAATLTNTNFEVPSALTHTVNVNGARWQGEKLPTAPLSLPQGVVRKSAPPGKPIDVIVAIDTSTLVGESLEISPLTAALKTLPKGSRVKLVDTRTAQGNETPWTPAEDLTEDFLRSLRFVGGVDAVPALMRLSQPQTRPTTLLWLHGPAPQEAVRPQALLDCRRQRPGSPALVGLLIEPGEDVVMDALATDRNTHTLEGKDWSAAVSRAVAASQALPHDTRYLPLGGREPALGGMYLSPSADADGATDWARLVAASRVLDAWYSGTDGAQLAAAAARRRLITPLSGAVVLESAEQYKRHGLNPNEGKPLAASMDVATAVAPEPSTLAFFATAGAFFFARRRRSPITRRRALFGRREPPQDQT